MPELIIRPTAKFIRTGAILAAVIAAALEIVFWRQLSGDSKWLMALPPLLLAWPGWRWVRRRFTRTVIAGDRLRYETGIATRMTRNLQLSKIQDIRVDQGIMQRLWDVGDLSIQTAGETSHLTLRGVDSPQRLAEEVMDRVQMANNAA